jgi:hypothetical protein
MKYYNEKTINIIFPEKLIHLTFISLIKLTMYNILIKKRAKTYKLITHSEMYG